MKRLLTWTAVGGLACTLMGCGSLHPYNSAADAAATSAKADYDASKLTDSIKLARTVLDALDAKEVEAFRSVNLAERNTVLLSLLSESGTSSKRTVANGFMARFNKQVDERLVILVGDAEKAHQISLDIATAEGAVRTAFKAEELERTKLKTTDKAFEFLPACDAKVADLKGTKDLTKVQALLKKPDLKPRFDNQISGWATSVSTWGEKCNDLMVARAALAVKKQGVSRQLGTAAKSTQAESDDLTKKQGSATTAAADLKKASKALADAQNAATEAKAVKDLTCDLSKAPAPARAASATSPSKDAKPADPAEKKSELCSVLARLKELDDFGIKVLSEERLERINALLAAASGRLSEEDKAKAEPGLVLLSTTARFSQAWTQYQQAEKLPALEPLLIDKQLTTAQLAYAQAGVQLAESRLQYAQAYEDATLLELRLLTSAKAEIASLVGKDGAPALGANCGKEPTVYCASVSDLLNDPKLAKTATSDEKGAVGGEPANRRIYRALAYLSESFSVARDRQLEAELRLIDTEYRRSLSQSEAALANWDALLSVPVDQLKTYHAGGIRPAEAASLAAQVIQALAAVGIAVNIK